MDLGRDLGLLVLGEFGQGLKRQGFVLNGMLPGSRVNSVIEEVDQIEVKDVIGKEIAAMRISQERGH